MKKSLSTTLSFRKNLLVERVHNKKSKWSTIFFICSLVATLSVYAQTDTLIVRGKVENLTLKLYRQAPEISVARVNILQSNQEIVRAAQLQPDGSFELKMPLIYPQEECYLTYADVVMPFLGAKGTVEVTIFADSLGKSEVPLQFGGLYATTNNRHAQFYTAFNKWLKANPEKPARTDNLHRFWEKASQEQNRRQAFYKSFSSTKDPLLDKWVISSLENTTKAKLYNLLVQRRASIPTGLIGSANLDTTLFLTFAKADSYQQFMNHAILTTPDLEEKSLTVNKLSELILKYVPDLTTEDSLKLKNFIQGGKAKMRDLDFLRDLFNQKEEVLRTISFYELYSRKYGASYNEKELDFLKAVFYVININTISSKIMNIWYNHARFDLKYPYYSRSLDEIYHIENADSAAIQEARSKIFPSNSEVAPGQYLSEIMFGVSVYRNMNQMGYNLWEEIKQKNKGKAVYLIFWTNDEYGKRVLAEARELHASLPEDKVAFVYLCEDKDNEDVWIENVVKSKSKGLHIKLSDTQNDFFVSEWGITQIPHCTLIDANGKYIQRNAPLPANREGWGKIWNKVIR